MFSTSMHSLVVELASPLGQAIIIALPRLYPEYTLAIISPCRRRLTRLPHHLFQAVWATLGD